MSRTKVDPRHPCWVLRDNSLMFMTQNASVGRVTARMDKTEMNDFMAGDVSITVGVKERALVRDRG